MNNLKQLKSKANLQAKSLGHTLSKWQDQSGVSIANCVNCEMTVQITTNPEFPIIPEMSGYVLHLTCGTIMAKLSLPPTEEKEIWVHIHFKFMFFYKEKPDGNSLSLGEMRVDKFKELYPGHSPLFDKINLEDSVIKLFLRTIWQENLPYGSTPIR